MAWLSKRWAGSSAFAVLLALHAPGCSLHAQAPGGQLVWMPGASFQRRVTGSAPDVMPIPLTAGHFIRLEVVHPVSDPAASLRDPSGKSLMDVGYGNERYGPETLVAVMEVSGEYRLEVKLNDPREPAKDYTVNVVELREATPADRELVSAHLDYAEGERLIGLHTADALRQAVERLTAAHDYLNRSSDRYMSGLASLGLGAALRQSGEYRKTLPFYEEAAAAFHEVAAPRAEAEALNNEGGMMDVLGESAKALTLYQSAIALADALGDHALQARFLNNAGLTETSLSQWQGALEKYREALRLFREQGDRRREALVLNNIGVAYRQLGETEQAVRLFEQALPLERAAKDKRMEATTLIALSAAHLARGENAESLDVLKDALLALRTLGDKRGEAGALVYQGRAYAALGRSADARLTLLQSLDLARAVGDRRYQGEALVYLANVSLAAGDPVTAIGSGEQALGVFRTTGDRRLEAIALEALARAENARGNLKEARRRIEEALLVSEGARKGADSQQLRASFFATRQDAYSFYIDLLMRMGGEDALALETSERSRARSLLEMLAAAGDIREGVDPKLLARERELSNLLNAKGARLLPLLSANSPLAAELTQEIRVLESDYQDVEAAIRKSSPRYAAVTQPGILTAKQIQAEVLDRDTLLLEYSLGDERSYLWIAGTEGLRSYVLPSRFRIENQSRRVLQLLTAHDDKALPAAAVELSRMVFGDAGITLSDKRLIIVPDGALQSVPFAMLPDPSNRQPLISRHEVVMTPSASALSALRTQLAGRKPAPKMLAVFADPVFDGADPRAGGQGAAGRAAGRAADREPIAPSDRILEHLAMDAGFDSATQLKIARLPYTAQEAERILSIAPDASDLKATGFDATRALAISGKLSDYKYLHFATHGYLDTERPALSALVLSQIDRQNQPADGFLRVDDIYNARLSADLVVLSACQTGLGKEVRGEGLMGLTRAFLYAGVPRVIVSLWNVNDLATAQLMAKVYEKMLRHGKKPSDALRAAQLELRKQKRWESPYYWAAFVQHGDWK